MLAFARRIVASLFVPFTLVLTPAPLPFSYRAQKNPHHNLTKLSVVFGDWEDTEGTSKISVAQEVRKALRRFQSFIFSL